MELSKRNKKVAREVIEKGLQIEFSNGLNKAAEIIENWKKNNQSNREAYHALYAAIYDFDKHIERRYDRMTGSRYFPIVLEQLSDGIISEDDLKDFSPEVYQEIVEIKKRWEEYE